MLRNIWVDEDGAVTVDWVVLSAAIVGLGIAGFSTVSAGVENASGDVETVVTDYEISTSFGGALGALAEWTAIGLSEGGVAEYQNWMSGFTDDQLMAHMNNMEQYSAVEEGAGHPYETYHDEYYIARDEAAARGLL